MHPDEAEIDARLVRRLVAEQFPQWAELRVEPFPSPGTSNAIYRLGDGLAARLPRIASTVPQLDKELKWLPRLAPRLPLAVPVPVARGEPAHGYPYPWAVFEWLPGETQVADTAEHAVALARFVTALRATDTAGGPAPGEHNFERGVPLAAREEETRRAAAELGCEAAAAAWDAALRVSEWRAAPVWIHGDLQPPNLLVAGGRLSAVIDFAGLGVGDPACDLLPAWNLFSGSAREAFREAVSVDDATWARGRGWALSVALIALPYYVDSNPTIAGLARRTIEAVLRDP